MMISKSVVRILSQSSSENAFPFDDAKEMFLEKIVVLALQKH